ncbi:cytoplasmic protein [Bacillus haynesii]|uniref:cytoplasmic protein n=1 Tax=Bacillus haynesii TaxID=1925021 RepID=UPI00227FD4B7|nr:cytoplasmic protein [Bacillus haynesii]MCY7993388.1 cytoplasmic protein [Bacillus haynesii]MCY8641169.1 cytoplasmic protein [Bacillus haynesii]
MNFGKNTQLVEEVMSFIRNNKMFFNENFNVPILQVINNFSDAQNFAWSQDLNEVDTVWENVKSLETGNIVEKIYDLDLATQQDDLYEYFGDYENYSENFLPFDYVDIHEEIEGDLTMCALNRLVNGKTNNFYEKVFEIYKEGGWPCGWKGIYPKGEFIVFVPSSSNE